MQEEFPFYRRKTRERMARIIDIFSHNPKATYNTLAYSIKCSRKTVERDILALKKNGIIIKDGKTRSTSWSINGAKARECGLEYKSFT